MSDEQVNGVISSLLGQAEFAERESLRTGNASLSMLYRVQARAIESVIADRDRLAARLAEAERELNSYRETEGTNTICFEKVVADRDAARAECERLRAEVSDMRSERVREERRSAAKLAEVEKGRDEARRVVAALCDDIMDSNIVHAARYVAVRKKEAGL